MSNPNTLNFNPGGFEDRYDSRDYQLSEIAGAPAPFDWNAGFDIEAKLRVALKNPTFKIPVKDQNGSFSCGGQAWAYLAEVLEALNTGSFEERSAKFIYAQTYVPGGGSSGRDNGDVYVNQGVARESVLTSYDHALPPGEPFMEHGQDITDVVRMDAKADLSSAYAQTGTNIEDVATAIKNNNGVVLGVVGQNNGTWTSEFPKPPTIRGWAHWVYAGKARRINGVKHIGFINSWGLAIGNKGWQWLSEEYFNTVVGYSGAIFSGWAHVFNTAPPAPSLHHNFMSNLHFGQSGGDIIALQIALQIDGEFPKTVPTTGFYGQITASAILEFRAKYNISSSTDPLGKSVGPLTRLQLNKLFNV